MTIDIREGDILVVGALEYPIKSVDFYATPRLNTRAFSRMTTIAASTKRSFSSGGVRTAAETFLSGLKCTPLDPARIRSQLTDLRSPAKILQTFLADGDGYVKLEIEDIKQ